MKKKMISKMTALLLAGAMLAACSNAQTGTGSTNATTAASTTAGAATSAAETVAEETGILNMTGYPIVNEPITLTIGYKLDTAQGDWSKMQWFQDLAKESGINLEFVEYADNNAISLMYASRDYPDITFNVGGDKQLSDAVEAGDLYILDDYIDTYAPNWSKYLAENPLVKASITFPDGHIYSLPAINDKPIYEMRDLWVINKNWLDELGLEMPTTVDEFYEVLKAFKSNAGTGTIPQDVIPYYVRGITNSIGGALDFINTYGVRLMGEATFATIDDNGKVEFNYVNEDIKEPMKMIHKMVEEGLIAQDCFTDDQTTYLSKTNSTPTPISGSYHAYYAGTNGEVPLVPLDSGNGKTPIIRSQTSTIMRNRYTIYKNCEYPEIAMRLADMIADEYWSVYNGYGPYDIFVEKRDDGTYYILGGDLPDGQYMPVNYAPYLMSRELYNKLEYSPDHGDYMRVEISDEYLKYMIPKKNLYPTFVYSSDNVDRISELQSDIKPYISNSLSKWALNGGIDEEWDSYIEQLNAFGLEEYLSLLQEEYDRFSAAAQ